MLDQIYYGNSVKDWGISLLIIIGALIINKLISLFYKKVINKFTDKSANQYDNIFFNALEKPVLLGIMLLAIWIAANRLDLGAKLHDIIAKSYQVLVVLNVTWFFARIVTSFIEYRVAENAKNPQKGKLYFDSKLIPLIKRSLLILIWVIGIVMALNNVGIKVTTLLGTLGIGGIAFALAAQDTIKNMFGGVMIFTDQTFRIGDVIKFDSTEGTVVDIGLRSTRIRAYDKRLVTIPNYKIMDALIINVSSEPARRNVIKLGLTYDTTPEKMQEAITILKNIPDKISDVRHRDLIVLFTEFADSALIITFTYYIRKSANIGETNSTVNFEILRAFTQAGLNFAFPSKTIYIENGTNTEIPADAKISSTTTE